MSKFLFKLTMALLVLCLVLGGCEPESQTSGEFQGVGEQKIELERILTSYLEKGFPGLSLALYQPEQGTSIRSISVGLARKEDKRPFQASDLFRIASCSKTYLGVLVLAFVDQGRLSLQKKVSDYLPPAMIEAVENAPESTIEQLLNHTTGIYDYFQDDFYTAFQAQPQKIWNHQEALRFAETDKGEASFEPGENYEYSNTNSILLALILEQVSGKTLSQLMREVIFAPLGLQETFVDMHESYAQFLVNGYMQTANQPLFNLTEVNQGYGLADGALITSPRDQVKFLRAIFKEKKILSPELRSLMQTDSSEAGYGLHLEVSQTEYGPELGHTGSIDGYQSQMVYYPQLDLAFALQANASGEGLDEHFAELSEDILQITLK